MYKILGADQKEYGPVTADQLRQWIREGRANAQTVVQGPNSTEWKPLNTFTEFADALAPAPAFAPGAPPSYGGMPGMQPHVPNYRWQSIACTVCCCPPLGIPGIVFAAQVNGKLASGDAQGALESSRKAKLWCWISFGVGIIWSILYAVFAAMGMFSKAFEGY